MTGMRPSPLPAPPSLREIAQELGSPALNRIVAGYGEHHASIRRVLFMLLVTAWTIFWARFAGPATARNTLPIEAARLLPWVPALLWIAIAWATAIRLQWIRSGDLVDALGSIANVVGIGVMLHAAWNISISMIAVLPFTTILVGGRLGRRAFYACMAATVLVVGIAAPSGYWVSRPAFIPFALLLLCGLPMTVNRLLSTLAELSRAAIASRDAQSRFLATMSHELRTPLNTVIHAAALIDASRLGKDDQDSLQALRTNADGLLHRVNEVLDVAAIAAGRLRIVDDTFHLQAVLQQVVDMMQAPAARKRIQLQIEPGQAAGLQLAGDPGRLEQALTNLVGNAIKFTPPGGTVELCLQVADGCVRYRVSDSGIGIPDEDKARIFEPFFQVSSGHARRQEGVGLGLHIVRSFCELSGGSVRVDDRPAGGSTFTLELPLRRAEPGDTPATEPETLDALDDHRHRIAPLRCLVVDDNAPNRTIVARLLSRAGHTVAFAESGDEAIAALDKGQAFDLMLLDMHMPNLSGLESLATLSKQPARTRPAVAMLSADSDPAAAERALALGARAYLTKPVIISQLLALLEQVAQGAATATVPQQYAESRTDERISVAMIRRLGSADDVTRYLALSHGELLRCRDTLDEVEYDADARHRLLHDLRNLFAAIDRPEGAVACRALEDAWERDADVDTHALRLRCEIDAALDYLEAQPEFATA